MYSILLVDDEPLICKGLSGLLEHSGLPIRQVFTAHSGYEALDVLRMEEIDLLVTDIQMGAMNGIELMHQAKIIKPWVETMVISAHENFQYAQLAIKLGARDYLLKPLKSEQFLVSVRNALLGMEKPAETEGAATAGLLEHFRLPQPDPVRTERLNRLLAGEAKAPAEGDLLRGPYFCVLRLHLLEAETKRLQGSDGELYRYAALNIASELLEREWRHEAFYAEDGDIAVILQWSEAEYADAAVNRVHLLDMIGRSLHFNIHKFLGISAVVGISQILCGIEFMRPLNEQAVSALAWHRTYPDHYVFYYGDFKWSLFDAAGPTQEEVSAQSNAIVEKAAEYIRDHYMRKGLTLNEVALKNHVSPNYLSYLFKKTMGMNLWEYVIKQRMEESRRLLQHTDLRRYEISERVGYESPEHFSKIFKKYFGVSPSEMKK